MSTIHKNKRDAIISPANIHNSFLSANTVYINARAAARPDATPPPASPVVAITPTISRGVRATPDKLKFHTIAATKTSVAKPTKATPPAARSPTFYTTRVVTVLPRNPHMAAPTWNRETEAEERPSCASIVVKMGPLASTTLKKSSTNAMVARRQRC